MAKNYHSDNKSFVIYKDWEEYVDALGSDEEAGKLFKALFAFAKRAEEAEFVGALKMAFIVMRNSIERDGEKWENTCSVRSEAGKKGGRPSKTNDFSENQIKANGFFEKQTKAKKADKDTDKDTDTEKEIITLSPPPKKSPPKAERHKHGEYNHVLLTDEQLKKLNEDFGNDTVALYIRKVDEYCQQTGKTYKDYNLTIRNWIGKDGTANVNNGNRNVDTASNEDYGSSKYATEF